MRSYHCWFCRETLFTTKKGIAGHERTCHASEIEAGGRICQFPQNRRAMLELP
jgi:hypothetical protein